MLFSENLSNSFVEKSTQHNLENTINYLIDMY